MGPEYLGKEEGMGGTGDMGKKRGER